MNRTEGPSSAVTSGKTYLSLTSPLLRGGTKNVGYSISVVAIKNARQRTMVSEHCSPSLPIRALCGHAHFVYWCVLIRT